MNELIFFSLGARAPDSRVSIPITKVKQRNIGKLGKGMQALVFRNRGRVYSGQ